MEPLLRNPSAIVLKSSSALRILVPPDRLLTLHGEDAHAAERLLADAATQALEAPPRDTAEGQLVQALADDDVFVAAPDEPSIQADGSPHRAIRLLYGITGAVDAVRAHAFLDVLAASPDIEVRVVMTRAATRFVSPDGLGWSFDLPVATELFAADTANHVVLGEWADVVAVVPAAAEFICRLAAGGYSDLLASTIGAARGAVVLVPGMNERLWRRRAVQRALGELAADGIEIVLPGRGTEVAGKRAKAGFGGPGVGPDELPLLVRLLAEREGTTSATGRDGQ
jgi:hypothetical protein